MDQSPNPTWAEYITQMRGTFQETYEAMTVYLEETTQQWNADLQSLAAALDHMRELDRQRQQILNEVTERMARMHAVFLRTTLGPELEYQTQLMSQPEVVAQIDPETTPLQEPDVVSAADEPIESSESEPVLFPEPVFESAPEPVFESDEMDTLPQPAIADSAADEPAPPPPPPFANPGATYGPPMPPAEELEPNAPEPVLPRLIQNF